jgi:hypothetical protein
VSAFVRATVPRRSAGTRLKALASFVVIEVKGELSACIESLKMAHALYDLNAMAAYNERLNKLFKCKSEGPDRIKKSVQQLRAALKAQNISEAPLKDFIITYQKINGIIGDTTNAEADQYQKILAAKGEAITAELEW